MSELLQAPIDNWVAAFDGIVLVEALVAAISPARAAAGAAAP
jgi:hypothetical protein